MSDTRPEGESPHDRPNSTETDTPTARPGDRAATAATDAAVDWEAVGRQLLAEQLMGHNLALTDTFGEASEALRDRDPTPEDIEALYAALDEARYTVDSLAEITPGADRRRETFEYLDAEERRELAERMGEADE